MPPAYPAFPAATSAAPAAGTGAAGAVDFRECRHRPPLLPSAVPPRLWPNSSGSALSPPVPGQQVDTAEFDGFIAALARLYPGVHTALELERVNGHALLFRWPGTGRGGR